MSVHAIYVLPAQILLSRFMDFDGTLHKEST